MKGGGNATSLDILPDHDHPHDAHAVDRRGKLMSKCPICGRINVPSPAGYKALCGRRVSYGDMPAVQYPHQSQWPERMSLVSKCVAAAKQ